MRPTTSWFSDLYGFSDETGSFEEHRAHFRMDGEDLVCATSTHPRQHVGPWETPSVAELRERCGSMTVPAGGSGLTFRHLAASSGVEPLISNPDNAGAVFMVASQFNALEMVGPGVTPEKEMHFAQTIGLICYLNILILKDFRPLLTLLHFMGLIHTSDLIFMAKLEILAFQ